MVCPKCGTQNEDDAKFCKSCAEPFTTAEVNEKKEETTLANSNLQEVKSKIGEQFNSVKQEIAGVKSVGDAKTLVLKSRKIQIILGVVSLIILLFLILIIRGCSGNANPASDFTYQIGNKGVIITKYIGNSNDVIIPNKIEGKKVTQIGEMAFVNCMSLKSVKIPNSVISIGNNAFSGCSSLENVKIPDSVTMLGGKVFYYCTALSNVTIGKNVPVIYDRAFTGTAITNIIIPDSVTSIGEFAFDNCKSLASVSIGKNVADIGNAAFQSCSLTSITIPDSVTAIYNYAFKDCTSMKSAIIGNGVTVIGSQAFIYCISLENVTIGDNVEYIGASAFDGCATLKSITIPDNVKQLGDQTFYRCSSLESVTLGRGLWSIGSSTFGKCNSLVNVTIPYTQALISVKNVFMDAHPLLVITYDMTEEEIKLMNERFIASYGNDYRDLIPTGESSQMSSDLNAHLSEEELQAGREALMANFGVDSENTNINEELPPTEESTPEPTPAPTEPPTPEPTPAPTEPPVNNIPDNSGIDIIGEWYDSIYEANNEYANRITFYSNNTFYVYYLDFHGIVDFYGTYDIGRTDIITCYDGYGGEFSLYLDGNKLEWLDVSGMGEIYPGAIFVRSQNGPKTDNNPNSPYNLILGTWETTNASITFYRYNTYQMYYDFNDDGPPSMSIGTYDIDINIICYPNSAESEEFYLYLDGNQLEWTNTFMMGVTWGTIFEKR